MSAQNPSISEKARGPVRRPKARRPTKAPFLLSKLIPQNVTQKVLPKNSFPRICCRLMTCYAFLISCLRVPPKERLIIAGVLQLARMSTAQKWVCDPNRTNSHLHVQSFAASFINASQIILFQAWSFWTMSSRRSMWTRTTSRTAQIWSSPFPSSVMAKSGSRIMPDLTPCRAGMKYCMDPFWMWPAGLCCWLQIRIGTVSSLGKVVVWS